VHGTRYSTRAAAETERFDDIEPFYNWTSPNLNPRDIITLR